MASITSESIDSITSEYNLPNIPVEPIEIANTPANAFGPTATTNKMAKIISGKARIPDKIHFPVEEIILSLVIFLAAKNPSGIAIIAAISDPRSEEHTSELQSRGHLVCRLLLEKKNIKK